MLTLVAHAAIGLVSAYVVHELGHVLAAFAVRARDVRWSPLRPYVDATLPVDRASAQAAFLAGGPLANAATAALIGAFVPGGGIVALVHALASIVTLLPGPQSDGVRLVRALRGIPPRA